MSIRLTRLLIFALLICSLVACGGPPNWVKDGPGALNKDEAKSIYGVGAIVGAKNEPLAWDIYEVVPRTKFTSRTCMLS